MSSQRQVIEQRIAKLEQEVTELARRVYDNELTWARMTPSWRLRVMEWRHRRRRGIPSRADFVAWAAIRTALSERGARLPEP